ncbi:hypothetical protein JOF42_002464 [Microbacterium phyllosphaerae]|uniref:Uncharacterized protein n=1 Tax=Microbacterium phyllosphaerae TaxID=124798 RepID=A0ABS4WTY0_9MICO|nr:hypothetical protein [Microbacterium phyllosphaerae]MBP2378969.1 hypothetical protein [Microbacterium phyllosphaerae]
MVDLRSRTHGPGATQGVNLVVMAYDDRVVSDQDGAVTYYLDARVHPADRRAPGQTNLALVSKTSAEAVTRFPNSARYSPLQLASIVETAAGNTAALTDPTGSVIGMAYGVRADLLINDGEVVVNTKTLSTTELSVRADEDGMDIRAQIRVSVMSARKAREAVRAGAVAQTV